MDIQSSAMNELFVLFPVIIQGWVTPVRPINTAHGGIPKAIYDDQLKGLECLVDPWVERFSQAVAKDDRIDLFLNNGVTPVDGKTIGPGEENLRVRLYVPKGRLRDGVNQIYYRVTRASGNGSENSRKLDVLYHLWAPGEPAPDAIRLQIPGEVVTNGVGPELATRGVPFGLNYDNRRPYDFISFTLGSRGLIERELTPAEGDPGQPFVQTLFTDTFRQNPDNPRTPVFYSVTDQLGNFNQSATHYIDVHVNRVTLAKAILREIPTENNDDPNTVDHDKLDGNPLSALIHLVETIWKTGDSIKLVFTAELNGGVVATHEETSNITQVPSQFVWSIPNNKIIANSIVKVVYQQVRSGAVIATSEPAIAQVIGESVIKLNPPTLVTPAVNPIDPLQYANGVTLRVEFLSALTGDQAQLVEINPPADAKDFPKRIFNANKRANEPLSKAFLAARHGKQITFRWALIRGGKEIARSGPLVLTVNRIVDGDTRFSTPVIVGHTGQELDVTKLVASDNVRIEPWTPYESGQVMWLRYDGFDSNGAAIHFDDLNGVPHTGTQGVTRPARVDWLKTLKHGTKVTITFRINFGKVADLNTAVTFPVRKYTVSAVVDVKPVITKIEDSKGVVVPNGGTTVDTTVTLTGTASKGQKVEIFDGPTRKDEATADPTTGIWTKRFTGVSVGARSYTAKALYGTGQSSAAWTLTVIAVQTPTITKAEDSKGVVVPNGGFTVDTIVTLTGAASKGQKVAIFDGTARKDEATADPTTGIWTKRLTGLSMGGHNFIAKALYGTEPVSNAWNVVRIAALQPPSITGVYVNGVRIPPGGSFRTPATVYFTGTFSPGPSGTAYMWINGTRNAAWGGQVSTNGTVWTSNSLAVQFFGGGTISVAFTVEDTRMGGNLRSPAYTVISTYIP